MKSAFVTGGTGFVGSHLVDRLLDEGYHVKCLVRDEKKLKWLENKNIEIIKGSLNTIDALKEGVKDVNNVYHCAGVLFGKTEESFIKGNLEGTQNIINACLEVNPKLGRFLYVGTLAAVGPSADGTPLDEDNSCFPLTWYGKSKLESEKFVRSKMDEMNITVIRPGAVYGPKDYAIYEVFKTSKTGINMKIGREDKYVSFIHVDDLVTAIYESSISKKTISQTYFAVNDDFNKSSDIASYAIMALNKKEKVIRIPLVILKGIATISELFGKMLNKEVVLNHQKVIELSQKYWIASNEKAKKDFSFNPKWSLEDGVKMTTEWYKKEGWL
jgi:dihydroflavonol-4-reductase